MSSDPENWIKASPKALADFYLNCNTKQHFREEFLKDPIRMLKTHGIEVSPKAAEEIKSNVTYLIKKYQTEIGVVPDWGEYGVELLENGWGFWIKATKDPGGIP